MEISGLYLDKILLNRHNLKKYASKYSFAWKIFVILDVQFIKVVNFEDRKNIFGEKKGLNIIKLGFYGTKKALYFYHFDCSSGIWF